MNNKTESSKNKTNAIDTAIIYNWSKKYVELSFRKHKIHERTEIIKACSFEHFNSLGMLLILQKYIGKIDEFIDFIQKEWNWIVTYDRKTNIIIADENKNYCICPLVKGNIVNSKELCFCSEGFVERMFSVVIQKKIKAKVVQSFLRDKKSCIYKIEI